MNFNTTISENDRWVFRSPLYHNKIYVNGLSGDDGEIWLNGQNIFNLVSGNTFLLSSLQSVSGEWDSVFTTVCANSALWEESAFIDYLSGQIDIHDSQITDMGSVSSDWNTSYTNLQTNSAAYLEKFDSTEIAAVSGNWDAVFTTVNANSASWDESTDILYLSGQIDTQINSLSTNISANYVPYTDATGNVNLGTYNLEAQDVSASTFSLNGVSITEWAPTISARFIVDSRTGYGDYNTIQAAVDAITAIRADSGHPLYSQYIEIFIAAGYYYEDVVVAPTKILFSGVARRSIICGSMTITASIIFISGMDFRATSLTNPLIYKDITPGYTIFVHDCNFSNVQTKAGSQLACIEMENCASSTAILVMNSYFFTRNNGTSSTSSGTISKADSGNFIFSHCHLKVSSVGDGKEYIAWMTGTARLQSVGCTYNLLHDPVTKIYAEDTVTYIEWNGSSIYNQDDNNSTITFEGRTLPPPIVYGLTETGLIKSNSTIESITSVTAPALITTSIQSKSILGTDANGKIIEGTHQDLSGYVPYTGATSDLNLGYYNLSSNSLNLSGNLIVDTNTLYVDASTNRVGIGNASPNEALTVVGNVSATGTITANNLSGTNTGDQDLSGFVPYTDASVNVNLGDKSLSTHNIYVPGVIAHGVITGVNADAYIDLRTNSDFDGDDIAIVAGYRSSEDDNAGDLLLSAGYNDQMENYGDVVIQGSKITLQTEQSDQLVDINGTVEISNTITASNLSGTNTGDQDLSGFVPYTGANKALSLGSNNFTVGAISNYTLYADAANTRVGIATIPLNTKLQIYGSHVNNYGLVSLDSPDKSVITFRKDGVYQGCVGYGDIQDEMTVNAVNGSVVLSCNSQPILTAKSNGVEIDGTVSISGANDTQIDFAELDVYGDGSYIVPYLHAYDSIGGNAMGISEGVYVIQRVGAHAGAYITLQSSNGADYSYIEDASDKFYLATTRAKFEFDPKPVRVQDKIIFTQANGNEFIDSLNSGYMDYGATTQHRFNKGVSVTGGLTATSPIKFNDNANFLELSLTSGEFIPGWRVPMIDSGTNPILFNNTFTVLNASPYFYLLHTDGVNFFNVGLLDNNTAFTTTRTGGFTFDKKVAITGDMRSTNVETDKVKFLVSGTTYSSEIDYNTDNSNMKFTVPNTTTVKTNYDFSDGGIKAGALQLTNTNNKLGDQYAPLEVHQNNDNAAWTAAFFNDVYSSTVPHFTYYGYNNGDFAMGTEVNTDLIIYTNGYPNERVWFKADGKVGIGKNNPAELLDVNGSIKGTGFKSGTATGQTTTVTVVTDTRMNGSQLQKKTQLLTFTAGLLTTKADESGWTDTTDI
jgi:hypothetical protein